MSAWNGTVADYARLHVRGYKEKDNIKRAALAGDAEPISSSM
jgi:hypothetical protein